jgi:hypothetical protein
LLFRRVDYENKGHNPEKLSWVRFPVKVIHVARKLTTIQEQRQTKLVRFGEEITETMATNPKTVLGSSFGENVGFRDNFFL